jgi:mRNA interferase MazF
LSASKLRPAVVLAETSHDDWLLCQITSKAYADPSAVRLTRSQLRRGVLNEVSYARPLKLFTANSDLIVKRVATLQNDAFKAILMSLIGALQKNLPG